MKRFVLIAVLCSLVACEGRRPELVDPETVKRDGIIYLARSTEPLTADVVLWTKSGQLRTQYTVINGKKEGLSRTWHENGQLEFERNYVNGKREGLFRIWRKNGQLWREHSWVNGKQEGLSRTWHENGQLEFEDIWVNGECVSGCE